MSLTFFIKAKGPIQGDRKVDKTGMKNMRKKEEESSSSVLTKEKTFEYVAQAHAKGARMRPRQTFFSFITCIMYLNVILTPEKNEIVDANFCLFEIHF